MFKHKEKGYRVERKVRLLLEQNGWRVLRAGGSFGEADLVCIKKGKCFLFQVKSTKKTTLYYYGYMENSLEGIPFYLVVDFGRGNTRVLPPKKKINNGEGIILEEFINR